MGGRWLVLVWNMAGLALLSRAERCYESFIGEKRDLVGRLISEFESALATLAARDPDLTFHLRWHPFQLNPDLPADVRAKIVDVSRAGSRGTTLSIM